MDVIIGVAGTGSGLLCFSVLAKVELILVPRAATASPSNLTQRRACHLVVIGVGDRFFNGVNASDIISEIFR